MNNSYSPVNQLLSSWSKNMEQIQKELFKARDVLCNLDNTDIARTPYDVVYEEDRVKLKHYRPEKESQYSTPLFIVYALINRETILDLQPGRSVIQNLLEHGLDVYMLDWGYPSRKDRFQTMDDHINGYIDNAVDFIRRKHNLSKINLMGVCMGGTFGTIYSALHPEKVKNLVLTVTPTSFNTDAGLLHLWWGNKGFDVDRLVNMQGNVSGDFLNFNFLILNPARLMIGKYFDFMKKVSDKKFVENFVRMEKWIFDSPDVPGETFSEFIKLFYQQDLLIKNELELGGRKVNLKNITMPVLNIYGQYDHLVPAEACNKIFQAIGSKDTEELCLKTGHIGIYVSSKSQKVLAPKICQWLKERDKPEKKKSTPKAQKSSSSKSGYKKKQSGDSSTQNTTKVTTE